MSATAADVTDSTARFAWDYTAGTDPVDGTCVGRDGTDTNGTGTWSTDRPAVDGELTFTRLLPGITYPLWVELLRGGQVVGGQVVAEQQVVNVTTTRTTAPATSWADSQSACENQWQINGQFADWDKPLVVAIGGKWNQTWQTAATGGMDGIRRTCLTAIADGWGDRDRANLVISLFHESNGSWYDWSVRAADIDEIKAAWAWFRALQQQIVPGARLMLALNADHVPSGGGYTPEQMSPPPASSTSSTSTYTPCTTRSAPARASPTRSTGPPPWASR